MSEASFLKRQLAKVTAERDRYRNDYCDREQELQDLRSYKRAAEDKREWAQGKYDEQIRSNLALIRERDELKADNERLRTALELARNGLEAIKEKPGRHPDTMAAISLDLAETALAKEPTE